ncbi:MAG: hypothetical protein AB9882_00525 [Ignavibacteriaceae bacterium]
MTVVLSVSYIIYRVKKKSKNPHIYIQPKVIVSKHNKDKKEVITLPPPKPAPLKVKVEAQKPIVSKMQPVKILQQTAAVNRETRIVNPAQTSPSVRQNLPGYPVPQVNARTSNQQPPPAISYQERPINQYPQYTNSGEQSPQQFSQNEIQQPQFPPNKSTIYRSTGQSYPKVTVVSATRQTNINSPQDRFQVINQPKDLPKTSLSIAYYGVDRLSYQPPQYLRIDSQDQKK